MLIISEIHYLLFTIKYQ